MFDITSSKLLILVIVALIVVGPKDLPVLLRTVGKYLGVVRRHAADFRAQLDEAIREAELEDLKKDFESVGREMRATIEEAAIDDNVETKRLGVDSARESVSAEVGSAGEAALAPQEPRAQTDPTDQIEKTENTENTEKTGT
jgi:sec-independent protein translocase protein TatB